MSALAPPRPIRGRIRAYARLAKLDVYDYHLAVPLAWTMLPAAARRGPATVPTLLAFLLGTACVLAATVAFDDVTGYRDGSDALNYGPDAPARRMARKPLLTGALTDRQALRFAWCATAAGTGAWLLAAALAPHRPAWALGVAALCLLAAVQYSYGLRLSYRGGQELVLIGYGVGTVLAPYGLVAGRLDGYAAVQAILFGTGPLLFGLYSNTHDVAGDTAVARRTAAAVLGPRANRVLVAAVSTMEPVLVVAAALCGVAPWWLPLAMLPTLALRARQAVTGLVRHDVLAARRIGMRAHRVTVAALLAANLLAGGA